MKMPNWLLQRSEISPHDIAIEIGGERLTFLELHRRAAQRCGSFQRMGIQAGDVVALIGNNSMAYVECVFGLMYCGAVSLLLNARLTEYELQWQLEHADVKAIFSDQPYSFSSLLFSEMKIGEEGVLEERIDLEAPCTFMYTSGTTGKPKCVIHTYGNHYHSAIASAMNLGVQKEDAWLSPLPLFHVGGFSLLIKSVIYGMPIHVLEKYTACFLSDAILQQGITITSVVPKMVMELLQDEEGKKALKQLRVVLVGGAPVAPTLIENCMEQDISLYQTYGMTETASQIATISLADLHRKRGSVGKALWGCEIKIRNHAGISQPFEEGEITVRGANVSQGYRYEEKRKEWFQTGDIGYMDDEGFLYICDRRKDLIISGGENIYPVEIENAIYLLEGVKEVGVIGISSKEWGQRPIAIVYGEDFLTKEAVLLHCQKHLAKYKVPDDIIFVKECLPRNAMNKLMRHQLRGCVDENQKCHTLSDSG